jgi:unsaturated chondroitin disaccharide hydrolase
VSYTGLAVSVRLNPSGNIDARNAGAYAAASTIPYAANVQYRFRIAVNVGAHTYSAFVAPPGGAEQLLGMNYAFRTEQSTVQRLNAWSFQAGNGQGTLCDFSIE